MLREEEGAGGVHQLEQLAKIDFGESLEDLVPVTWKKELVAIEAIPKESVLHEFRSSFRGGEDDIPWAE